MNKEYVYEDEQEAEGITFKKIGRFFQKSWLRMIIYMVIAALLVTVVAVPVKVYAKSEPVAQTAIEFIYSGIEKGRAPDGKTLDTDNIISTTVLDRAVKESNLGKIIKDISTLRNAMRVEGVLTDEYVRLRDAAANGDQAAANTLRNYNMYPTRFDIIISDPSELGLSDDQAKQLLNKIVTCYYKDFQARFSIAPTFDGTTYNLSQNDMMEFADIYDMYLQSLDSVKAFLQEVTDSDVGFISLANNTTFAQLFSELNVLSSNYNQFNAYILSNNIWRNKLSAKSALDASKIAINNNLTAQEQYITRLTAMIKDIQPNTSTTDNGGAHTVTVSYPPEYFVYQAKLDEANRQVRDYNIQLNNIETRLDNLKSDTPTDATLIAQAVDNLQKLEAQTTAFIQKVQATVADYYDTTFVSSSVRQVQPPVVTRRSLDFNLLVVYAVALIVALLAAGIVTGVKMMRASSVKAEEQAPATETSDK